MCPHVCLSWPCRPYVLPDRYTIEIMKGGGKPERPAGILFICLVEARNLPNTDLFSKTDCYVRCSQCNCCLSWFMTHVCMSSWVPGSLDVSCKGSVTARLHACCNAGYLRLGVCRVCATQSRILRSANMHLPMQSCMHVGGISLACTCADWESGTAICRGARSSTMT